MTKLHPIYIVSLTTYYPRFDYAHLALESLLSQKCAYGYEVHLYLARADVAKNGGVIPPKIEALTKIGLRIFIKDEDLFSYNKLVYALRDNPEKTIITVDDDIIYPDNVLAELIQKSKQFPGCIVCFRGHVLSFDAQGQMRPYNEIMHRRQDDEKRVVPSFCLLPTGVSGVLYPPRSLDGMATDQKQFMRLSLHADDIWFKMASLKKGTFCVQIKKQNIHFPSAPMPKTDNLAMANVDRGENDRQLQACFAAYPALLERLRQDAARLDAICHVSVILKIRDYLSLLRRRWRARHLEKRNTD
ncbi:hypothetical protein AGMMS50276_07030 [Synergistales bacterium]|nr:hypothetical protein AGMMS50276_07030 [Synergistales bacterium]